MPPSAAALSERPLSLSGLLAMSMHHYVAAPQEPDHGTSWMAPDAKAIRKLLYISDHHTDDVYVYNFASGKLVGKLTGFSDPYGECVDAKGDVWIANFSGSSVVEYAHGGTTPIATLATNGYAIGCSVAPEGDLSVADLTTPSGAGNIELWQHASGTPISYSNSEYCYYVWPPGDDNYGNMFVETNASNYVCELYYGGSQGLMPGNSSFSQSEISFPGGSMWDGEYVTFTDQQYDQTNTTAIYQTIEEPCGGLMVIGTTVLTDTCHNNYVGVVQPFIVGEKNTPNNTTQGTLVVGGNTWCKHRVDVWNYPAGGNPVLSLKSAPLEPYGGSVSIK
jgi:hypothetical protein